MLANLNDIQGLKTSIDLQVQAANAAVGACNTMVPSDLTAWAGFYQQWSAETDKIDSYFNASWYNFAAKIDEVLLAQTWYDELQQYAAQLKVWQQKIAAECQGYTPPPSPIVPPPTPSQSTTSTIADTVKWGAIGLLALAGLYVTAEVFSFIPKPRN